MLALAVFNNELQLGVVCVHRQPLPLLSWPGVSPQKVEAVLAQGQRAQHFIAQVDHVGFVAQSSARPCVLPFNALNVPLSDSHICLLLVAKGYHRALTIRKQHRSH